MLTSIIIISTIIMFCEFFLLSKDHTDSCSRSGTVSWRMVIIDIEMEFPPEKMTFWTERSGSGKTLAPGTTGSATETESSATASAPYTINLVYRLIIIINGELFNTSNNIMAGQHGVDVVSNPRN